MTLTLAPALLALLALVSDSGPSATPRPSKQTSPSIPPAAGTSVPVSPPSPIAVKHERRISVTSVEPANAYSGDLVTIKGSGLDQGSVLLLGPVSPVIVEATDEKIVFRAPGTDGNHPEAFESILYLVTPGFAVTSTNVKVRISPPWLRPRPDAAVAATPPTGAPAREQKFDVSASKAFTREFDFDGARSLDISLTCTGAEVEVAAQRADGTGPRLTEATFGGSLAWTIRASDLAGKGGKSDLPGRIKATFSTDSVKAVPCRIGLNRKGPPSAVGKNP
jgi:IPT/TIG domain